MFSDEVVCIDASNHELLVEGKIYPLLGYRKDCHCGCKTAMVNVGLPNIGNNGKFISIGTPVLCHTCFKVFNNDGIYWVRASRFSTIDSVDISELTERLTEEPFKV